MKAKPDAMEKFETWFGSFVWSGDLKVIHGRAFRRHLRALLRERAEAAEWAYMSALGEMGTNHVSQAIRAAVLGRPARREVK